MKSAVGLMIAGGMLTLSTAATAQENSTPMRFNGSILVGYGEGCPSVAEQNSVNAEVLEVLDTVICVIISLATKLLQLIHFGNFIQVALMLLKLRILQSMVLASLTETCDNTFGHLLLD